MNLIPGKGSEMPIGKKCILHIGIAAATILFPSLVLGQQSVGHNGSVPDGWYVYPDKKLSSVDETALRCFNYSRNEWQVNSQGDSVKITRVAPQKGDERPLPPMLKHQEGMPGRTIREGLTGAMHLNNALLLAYDAGEWGGGLWLTTEDGSNTKRILSDNVRAVIPIDGGVL